MNVLKLVSVLLEYPRAELWMHAEELREAAADPVLLTTVQRVKLTTFIEDMLSLEPMRAEERWLELFDRGRAMSLLLFEHIHGESRDRGQAMVDLAETYRKNGFEIGVRQLPDYLPLMLEYLSTRPDEEVFDWLKHVNHILELLAARAQERESPYASLFEILVGISQGQIDLTLMRKRVSSEERDDTPEAIDRVWEEEAVRFGPHAPDEDCAPSVRLPAGIKRMDPKVLQ